VIGFLAAFALSKAEEKSVGDHDTCIPRAEAAR
jgi:hypothetical protein